MVGNHRKIYELGTNRRTRNKRMDSERNQRKKSKGSGGRMEREELEKKNSLWIYRRFKKEMKDEDHSGSLARVNGVVESENKQLKFGGKSWQRNREICVGCADPESKKQTKSLENSCSEDTKVIRKRERY